MKKVFLSIFILLTVAGYCQTNNSWIDYNKTYYKFKVGATGLYRISQSALSSMGLGNTSADQFQLWRNGEQVRIYTSATSGPLPSSGYIEFWGILNDGKKDTKLYLNPDYQLSDHWSLETDTAAYFLSVNASGGNLRFTDVTNNVAGNILPPEPYFMNTKGVYYRSKINPGYAQLVGEYVYSSSYDIGEGWTSSDIASGAGNALSSVVNNLNLYAAGPPASFNIAAAGNALNGRNIRVTLANTVILDTAMDYFGYLKKQVTNIPVSAFTSPDFVTVSVQNTSSASNDYMVVSFFEIKYPSKFNFNNSSNFAFELPATTTGNYLVIDNFNYGSVAPVLLDLNTGNRYTCDISTGKVRAVLPPSSDASRKFILLSEDASNLIAITNAVQRDFVNYSLTSNQGNYLIISNNILYNNGSGQNYVDQYRAYRSSSPGGSFTAKVYDMDQLNDQFGFGIKQHPASVKDFLQFAKINFAQTPKDVFLIGKGLDYVSYQSVQNTPAGDMLDLIPTFGNPASDIRLSSNYNSLVPDIPVGRLSVVNGNEIAIYLEKMKEYEQAQASTSQTVADKAWMKNIVHVSGGSDQSESDLFNYYMNGFAQIIKDTLFGGVVDSFSKTSTASVQLIANQSIEQLFQQGISMLTYFGHSSANTLAFNLDDPQSYNNLGKYPLFNVNGCVAGNNYTSDTTRLQGNLTLSEKYVLANERGSIGFLASTHLGIPPFLNNYQTEFYTQTSSKNYGNSVGSSIRNVIQNLGGADPNLDFFTRMHMEEMNLNGDPALKINAQLKPDYVIEEPMIHINPSIISVIDNKFSININMLNIGKAINDSIRVIVKRTLPDNSTTVLFNKIIPAIKYEDSISLTALINPLTDKGLNKITVILDADNHIDEISELNNTATTQFFIFEDEVSPVYPYNFSIINQQNITFFGSTANPLLPLPRQAIMEIDTTELFNSAIKQTFNTTTSGGIVQFTPAMTLTDGTVYYWRMAMQPVSGSILWNTSSFIYLQNGGTGFNQSDYYQHLKSDTQNISLGTNRQWKYSKVVDYISAKNGVFPTAASAATDFSVTVNGSEFAKSVCGISGIIFNVLDPISLKPWQNVIGPTGLYGSQPVCGTDRLANFQFNILDQSQRKKAMDFLDLIPDSFLVIVRNISGTIPSTNTYASDWMADTAAFGSNNSIYYRLKSQGFVEIDSFNRPRSFIFMYQKNSSAVFFPQFIFSDGISDKIELTSDYAALDTVGYITSPVFGPVKAWKQLHWRGSSQELNSADNPTVSVIGIDNSGNKTTLLSVNKSNQDVDISSINATQFPFVQLQMRNADSIFLTPYQLSYWRLNADYAPEGAIAPNIFFKMKDTANLGETIDFGIAFKNISPAAFDSLKVKVIITDQNNVPHTIILPKQKTLKSGDTLTVLYSIDTKNYAGNNTLYVEVNPDNDQPEQYHFNNFIYKNFFVKGDLYNPLLDVTFDGVHILNRDIVSARPHIVIKLKDENKDLALNDTSLLKIQIRMPDGTIRSYRFDNDTVKFTPANLAAGENTATVDFTPLLTGQDDEYELIVSGKDVAGNNAGNLDYHVIFRVISKPMISNLLNYPNPFTTSTAFVFTVTGTQPPQNIRIEILTITGKIVREITSQELGTIHIGRNITDFKWDGTDMYGQKLANGVYLYRVLTNLYGKSLDKFTDSGDNTDQYFTKGYGKMYLLNSNKY